MALFLHQFPLLAFAAAAVASFDREHEVIISFGDKAIKLVLHHRCDPDDPCHQHGLAAQFLTRFDSANEADHADHVLYFSFAGDQAPGEASKFSEAGGELVPPEQCDFSSVRPLLFPTAKFIPLQATSPLAINGVLAALRTVRLVV